jgi:hypothetical protein
MRRGAIHSVLNVVHEEAAEVYSQVKSPAATIPVDVLKVAASLRSSCVDEELADLVRTLALHEYSIFSQQLALAKRAFQSGGETIEDTWPCREKATLDIDDEGLLNVEASEDEMMFTFRQSAAESFLAVSQISQTTLSASTATENDDGNVHCDVDPPLYNDNDSTGSWKAGDAGTRGPPRHYYDLPKQVRVGIDGLIKMMSDDAYLDSPLALALPLLRILTRADLDLWVQDLYFPLALWSLEFGEERTRRAHEEMHTAQLSQFHRSLSLIFHERHRGQSDHVRVVIDAHRALHSGRFAEGHSPPEAPLSSDFQLSAMYNPFLSFEESSHLVVSEQRLRERLIGEENAEMNALEWYLSNTAEVEWVEGLLRSKKKLASPLAPLPVESAAPHPPSGLPPSRGRRDYQPKLDA